MENRIFVKIFVLLGNFLTATHSLELYFNNKFVSPLKNPEIPFNELGPAMHYGRINSLSMCAWKPIFITSGEQDKSIRVWNYMTDDIELIKLYQEEIHCLSLHPTGKAFRNRVSYKRFYTPGSLKQQQKVFARVSRRNIDSIEHLGYSSRY